MYEFILIKNPKYFWFLKKMCGLIRGEKDEMNNVARIERVEENEESFTSKTR